jgi:hypothetical protein
MALRDAGYYVLRAGRRPEVATDFRLVDLDDPASLAGAMAGVDLVVTSIEDPQVRAERAVLSGGGTLLSMASLPAVARRRLDIAADQGARGQVILNSGLTGVGGLVVKDLLARHPNADTIELGYIVSTTGAAGLAGARYVYRLLVEQRGLSTAPRLFSAPIGRKLCFDLSGNDEVWLSPTLVGPRAVRAFLAVAETPLSWVLHAANRLRFLARLPEALITAGVRLKPRPVELSREPMRARLAVFRQGACLAVEGIDAEGDYNSTVNTTVLFAEKLLTSEGYRLKPGVTCVEDLFRLQDFGAVFAKDRLFIRPLPG